MTPTDRAMLTSDVAELGLPKDALDLLVALRQSAGRRRLMASDIVPAAALIKAGLVNALQDLGGITLWPVARPNDP